MVALVKSSSMFYSKFTIISLLMFLLLDLSAGQPPGVAQDNPMGAIEVVSGDGIITKSANFFDLEGRTVRFTSNGDGYNIQSRALDLANTSSTQLNISSADRYGSVASWSRSLPFSFPFAGQEWDLVYINLYGNLSFGRSEAQSWPSRDPWAGGTINSVANAISSHASTGEEFMIAGLWGIYDPDSAEVSFSSSSQEFVVTWRVTREVGFNIYYNPLGRNEFQIRIKPSGDIDLSYKDISEQDGFSGLISGQTVAGTLVDMVTDRRGDSSQPEADIVQMDVFDAGDVVRFAMTIATDVPERVRGGQMWYRVFFQLGNGECEVNLGVFTDGYSPGSSCGGNSFNVDGNRVDLIVSKGVLSDPSQIRWRADVGWWDFPNQGNFIGDQVGQFSFRTTALSGDGAGLDLSEADGPSSLGLLEVFHYPVIPKDIADIHSRVFAKTRDTELSLVVTDFRVDDVFGHGGSTGAVNVVVQGVGRSLEEALDGERFGSNRVQVAVQPTYIGQQRFDEVVREGNQTFIHHASAIGWMAHEIGHRWGVNLEFVNPNTGRTENLSDAFCLCHWDEDLHAPALHKVGDRYATGGYSLGEVSPMDGSVWSGTSGSFIKQDGFWLVPSGFSALDLYVMGLISADEVPDTFLVRNHQFQGNGRWSGTRVDFSIEDVLAAQGQSQRSPSVANSQKEFELTLYLVHEPGRAPHRDMVERAMRIAGELQHYFSIATGGRLTINLGGSTTDPDNVQTSEGSSSGTDTDGDGVPDEDDLCPTFPGSPATDGC